MKAIQLAEAGKVIRTHGVDGTLHLLADQPIEELAPGEALFLWEDGIRLPFFIVQAEPLEEGEWLVQVEELQSREAARRYAGHPFWLQAHLVGESAEEDSDLVGWKVEDADGKPVGVILSAVEMGEYILLTIDHQGREILLPLHDDLIVSLQEDHRTITLQIADGLLDLD
ncbi:MAG: hypothetical protein H6548_09855 [Chitinophagales bacterium]|nr:hypothetical protein [Chitinophagales bacterium]HAE34765.1 hypothetical protein [Bacteroidota bacterium]MCB9022413.1 hypothetical protein [Chitinophagales bacterium]HPE97459.1 hypothetical protein [Chitinophagales bacterium]HQU40726.1 hypothetical protein [Chitinophagales bacterium]